MFMTVYTDSHLGLAFLELQECRVFRQTHPYRGCPKSRITHCSHSEIQYTCNTWHIGDQDILALKLVLFTDPSYPARLGLVGALE